MKYIMMLLLIFTNVAFAQTRVIIPFPAGGGTDLVGRIIFNSIEQKTGHHFVIESIGGAGGDVGRHKAVRENSLLFTPNSLLISAYINKSSILPLDQFDPLVGIGAYPYLISSHPTFKYNLRDLKSLQKGPINIASAGVAGANHIIIFELSKLLKFSVQPIPHKGTPDALLSVMSGMTPLMVSGIQGTHGYIENKRLRAVAVTTTFRDKTLLNVPTVQQSTGVNFNYPGWFGVFAPKQYDKKTSSLVTAQIIDILKSKEVQRKLDEQSVTIWNYDDKEFLKFLISDDRQWKTATQNVKFD
jgi:tripartite-type tricarboxylate transporter receptor subunit TctC